MNRFTKTAIAAVIGFAAVAAPISQANADHRRHHHRNNDAVAAGILGLAAGALIVGAITQNDRRVIYDERRVYRHRPATVYDYPDAPRGYDEPEVITYDSGLEPWSRDWYRYCSDRYRSFNPETGTYRGHDGRNHFCQAG